MRRMRLTQESSRSEQTPDRQRPTLTRFTTLKALLQPWLLSAFSMSEWVRSRLGWELFDAIFQRQK